MGKQWQVFEGDTSRFAVEVSLRHDPHEGVAATVGESASWGGLKLWVGGVNLCEHHSEGERMEWCHWYLLPIFRWIAENWAPLFHEARLPAVSEQSNAAAALVTGGRSVWMKQQEDANLARDAWWRRHCVLAARHGGVLPEVYFRRYWDLVEISWRANRVPGTPVDLTFASTDGVVRLSADDVWKPMLAAMKALACELDGSVPNDVGVSGLVARVREIEDAADSEVNAAWLLGLTTTGDVQRLEAVRKRLESVAPSANALDHFWVAGSDQSVIPSVGQAALLFGCLSPTVGDDDIVEMSRVAMSAHRQRPVNLGPLEFHGGYEQISGEPWADGYDLALDFIDAQEIDTSVPVQLDKLVKSLGINSTTLGLDDPSIRAVSLVGDRLKPTIALNHKAPYHRSKASKRFTIAHELCHLLHDRKKGTELAVASGPWAPREVEQRANAFAAMLLMPPELIEAAVAGLNVELGTVEGVETVAGQCGTSYRATLEHLHNLGLLDVAVRDFLRGARRYNKK